MTYCNEGHAEIFHYDENCPLCAVIEEQSKASAVLQETIAMLKGSIEEQEARIEEYRKELGL